MPYHGLFKCQAARDAGGVEALFEVSRRKPNLKNRVDETTEKAVVEFATAFPAHGQVRVSNELRKQGIFVSPSGVRSIWLRHNLASMKQRLTALEKLSAEQGMVLTEAQVQALERKNRIVCGEIESHHPGYLGSQDTFYVGTIKGVGRIYQQTFVDTYSKWAAAKLYTTKTPITAADLLNDRVLPFFASQNMGVIRIMTDRGTEYCGKLETHDYQLYLGVNGIEHTKTKAHHPQTNGICERFHKTILHEVLPGCIQAQLISIFRRASGRFGCLTGVLQHKTTPSRENVLRQNTHANPSGGEKLWDENFVQLN